MSIFQAVRDLIGCRSGYRNRVSGVSVKGNETSVLKHMRAGTV